MITTPQRNTRQRKVILEELKKLKCHPTATELYEAARSRIPKISLGTVYRNLELLASNGIIKKLEFSGAEARFDGNTSKHYHARCIHCGRVDDVCGLPANFATGDFKEFLMGEVRYSSLTRTFPEAAEKLFEKAEKDAKDRFETYKRMAAG